MTAPNVFQVRPVNKRECIPMRAIHAIARHIADNFDPDQIILFGSHAYGKPDAWSDVDLLVVMDTPKGQELDKSLEIRRSLPSLTFGLDVVVRSRKLIEKRKKLGDWFLLEHLCITSYLSLFSSSQSMSLLPLTPFSPSGVMSSW